MKLHTSKIEYLLPVSLRNIRRGAGQILSCMQNLVHLRKK